MVSFGSPLHLHGEAHACRLRQQVDGMPSLVLRSIEDAVHIGECFRTQG